MFISSCQVVLNILTHFLLFVSNHLSQVDETWKQFDISARHLFQPHVKSGFGMDNTGIWDLSDLSPCDNLTAKGCSVPGN